MKKRKLKATLAVALVAAAGVGAYETYQDYKTADAESNMMMQNVEALTSNESSVTLNDHTCPGESIWAYVGIAYDEFTCRDHSSANKDVIQTYTFTYCKARGSGEKKGSQNVYWVDKKGNSSVVNCEESKHAPYDDCLLEELSLLYNNL